MKKYALASALVLTSSTLFAADPVGANESGALDFSGKVLETMNAATYTYVRVDTGKATNWAAAPQFAVKVGDAVTVESGMPMPNYHSKTLNRDFDVVYFTGRVRVAGASAQTNAIAVLPQGHPPIGAAGSAAAPSPSTVDLKGIKPAKGGKTVADLIKDSAKLNGKSVSLRGKVVKYNSGILNKNWLHIRDGSGAEGSNDLTVTTATVAKVGDTVLVSGKLVTNRDFGSGYKYDVIIEDADVVVE